MRYSLECDREAARRRGGVAVPAFLARAVASAVVNGTLERLGVSGRGAMGRGERAGGGHSPGRRRSMAAGAVETAVELRHAARRLARRPGFTAAAIGTLGLGIGATTAIFSVVEGVLLRPLPYPDAGRLVAVHHMSPGNRLGMPAAGYFYYGDHATTLFGLALYLESSSPIAGTGAPLELGIIQATASLLPMLGVRPALGRLLLDSDAEPGAPPVAVITHGYWVHQLGSDPAVIGKPVLEGSNTLVVGVLPADFRFVRPEASITFGNPFADPDVYVPLEGLDRSKQRFGNFMYQSIGRLAPGATPESALAELKKLMPEAAEAYSGSFTPAGLAEGGYAPVVTDLKASVVGDTVRVLWIVQAAVAFVLLIAVANVANLFLVRAESRRGEISVRRALGASGWALARVFLSESLLLAVFGGAVGVALAAGSTGVLLRLAPDLIPRLDQVGPDMRVLLFAAVVTGLAGLVFAAAPLARAVRVEIGSTLGEEGRGGTIGRERRRLRETLVVAQIALAVVLLVASGLLLRTFDNLRSVRPGFDGSHTLTVRLSLSGSILRAAGRTERAADLARSRFMIEVADRLGALPGVESAGFTGDLPLDDNTWYDFVAVEGAFPADLAHATKALRVFMGPGYLKAIGAPLLRGRELEASDFADQPRAVVVNRSFAEQRWPGQEAVGRRLLQYWDGMDPTRDVWYTVVGVVGDIREVSLMTPPEPTVYLPTAFLPDGDFAMFVSNMIAVVRTTGEPGAVLPRVLDELRARYPEVPITRAETADRFVARSFQDVSFAMFLLIIAATVSVALGIVGIYGTVAYVVGQRRREFGVRIALGASGWDVRRSVLRHGSLTAAAGIGIGIPCALASARVLQAMLFGVGAGDPLVYGGVAGGLLVLVLAAAIVPAGRAADVDPVEAMKAG